MNDQQYPWQPGTSQSGNPYQQPGNPYGPQGPYPSQGPYVPQLAPETPQAYKKRVKRNTILSLVAVVLLVIAGLAIKGFGDHLSPASSGVCTSSSCIVSDLQSNLVGLTAKDDLVSTKAVCEQSTAKDDGNGIFAATCTVTYSDGSTATGTGTLETQQKQVSFSPALP
jgi:hypothetical protein